MYERFYGLRERPFALSPDPDYLYPSRVHREALDYLRYGLETHAGFVVITGEIGSGKTTLLQTLLRGLDAETTVGRIVNTLLEPRELIETIMIDFGLDPTGRSKPIMLRDLAQFLVDQRMAGRLVLLVIDEAQNLSLAALEELRMLSNLETEKSKLLQIVMVGQPNLREKLNAPELEQLRQRITVSYHLQPLDAGETENYINHRLRRAAVGVPLEFPREVTDVIHARSRGVPRIINVICDATLVFGYAEERRQIDSSLMDDVLSELEMTGVLPDTGLAAQMAERRESAEETAEAREAAAPLAAMSDDVAALKRRATNDDLAELNPRATADNLAELHSRPTADHLAQLETRAATDDVAGLRTRATSGDAAELTLRASEPEPARATNEPAVAGRGFSLAEPVGRGFSAADAVAPTFRPAPAATMSPIAEDQARRVAAIEQREELLRQRERELAQQRRVLAEEYRLLRTQRSMGESDVSPAGRARGARFEPREVEGFWGWLKRVMTGTQPTIERR